MNYLILAARLLFIAVSLGGISLFANHRLRIAPAFLPIFTISTVSILLFLGGLLGVLLPVTYALYAIGILLLIWELIETVRGKYSPVSVVTAPGVIVFLLFSLFFVIMTRGMQVLHVDNFSHWAVIAKEMCLTDAFPVEGTAVSFRNYTPGSTLFIYFICKILGFSEGHALLAQGMLISAAVSTVFVKVRLREVGAWLALLGATVAAISIPTLLSASLSIYNLLVDGLIAYVAVAGGVIAYAYRRSLPQCLVTLTPVLVLLALTKSSAKLFSIMVTLIVLISLIRFIFRRGALKAPKTYIVILGFALLVALQFILPAAYDGYILRTFPEHVDKFPTDAGGIIDTITEKSPEYLEDIFTKIKTELSNPESDSAIALRAFITADAIALAVLVLAFIVRCRRSFITAVFITANLTAAFYICEMFVLYGFIFAEEEATILASFYRYFSTGAVVVTFPLLAGSIYQLLLIYRGADRTGDNGRRGAKRISVMVVTSVLMLAVAAGGLITVKDNLPLLVDPYRDEDTAARREARADYDSFLAAAEEKLPRDSYVCIYTSSYDFLLTTLPPYALNTCHSATIYPYMLGNEAALGYRLSFPKYFVVHSDQEGFVALLSSRGYTFVGESDVYEVDRDAMTLTAK